MNFISCAKWIKQGVAKGAPFKVELTPEELRTVIKSTKDQIKELEEGNGELTPEELQKVINSVRNQIKEENNGRRPKGNSFKEELTLKELERVINCVRDRIKKEKEDDIEDEPKGNQFEVELTPKELQRVINSVKDQIKEEYNGDEPISNPFKVKLTPEELQRVINCVGDRIKKEKEDDSEAEPMEGDKIEDDNEDEPMEEAAVASSSSKDKYDLENYDEEDDMENSRFGIGKLVVVSDEEDYAVEGDDSEEEDDKIKIDDNLIVVGHVDGDASVLEVYVYNEEDGDLYVHHDILLPSVPLCLEWLSHDPSESNPGNLIAVGSMSAVIAIWDLDIMGCLEPAYLLGKFSMKKKRNKKYGHKDAVLDLAWNTNYKHILASGSVDKTVLLWDLDTGKPSTTFSEFEDKVQSIKWEPVNYHLLLTGSADKTAKLFDCRMVENSNKWVFNEEIEKVAWSKWDNNKVYFGTNGGNVIHHDLRYDKKPLWEIKAHDEEITGLEIDRNCVDLLFTCSTDKSVKTWNIKNDSVKLKTSKSFNLGELHCLDLNPNCPYVACIGGTKKQNNFKVVNLLEEILQPPVQVDADTNPVVFNDPSNARLQLTEESFKSLSIKNKKIKSKKKIGHKYKSSS